MRNRNIFLYFALILLITMKANANNIVDKTNYTNIDNIINQYNNLKKDNYLSKIKDVIYVFVSFSMSDRLIKDYFLESQILKDKYNKDVIFVMRGFYNNSFKGTFLKVNSLIKSFENKNISIVVNPILYKKYNVKQVPTIVLEKSENNFDKIAGSISIKYALEQFDGVKNEQ